MYDCIPYKIVDGTRQLLAQAPSGWGCSEGDKVLLDTCTENLPRLRMAGHEVPPCHLAIDSGQFTAKYEIFIDTWAGRTHLELSDGVFQRTLTLDIGPQQNKLGADEFDAMLAELSQREPGLVWGLSPGAVSGIAGSSSPAVVHPAVIASQLPIFERLLARYLADPPVVTQRVREAFPLDLARRVDLATLRWLGKKPAVLRAVMGDAEIGAFADPRTPVDQPSATRSYDHPVTRYVAYLLHCLRARFKASAETLRRAPGRPFRDPVIEDHAAALAREMDGAGQRIEFASMRPLFRRVMPEPIGETALQSLADNPLYSAIHRVARRMLEPGLAHGPGGDLQSALKHTYELFELFVLYRLIDELPKHLGEGWALKSGKPLRYVGREERPLDRTGWRFQGPDGLSLELRYQQWFSRARLPPDERVFSSLSGTFIPDYILVLRKDGKIISWLILDAKYRSGRQAVDQGLADVHRYRDALRVRGTRADGAFVIVPRLQEENPAYASSEFLDYHAFGVIQLFAKEWLSLAFRRLKLRL